MRTHAQSVANDSRKPKNTSYTVRTPHNDSKKAGLPAKSSKPRTEEPHRFGNHVDALGGRAHAHSARIDKKSAAKTAKDVIITQSKAKLLQLTYRPMKLAPRWPGERHQCIDHTHGCAEHFSGRKNGRNRKQKYQYTSEEVNDPKLTYRARN